MGRIRSIKSLSGRMFTHFDENGDKIGISIIDASGKQVTHFKSDYNKMGVSFRNQSGRMTHYERIQVKQGIMT